MWVWVYVLRNQGAKIPRERLGEPLHGCLVVRPKYYASRTDGSGSVIAFLRSDYGMHGRELLPTLFSASLRQTNERGLMLVGYERISLHAPAWRQAWWCELERRMPPAPSGFSPLRMRPEPAPA